MCIGFFFRIVGLDYFDFFDIFIFLIEKIW